MNIHKFRSAPSQLETIADEDSSQLVILYGMFKILLIIAHILLYQAEEKS